MKCLNCGNEFENSSYCPNCGNNVAQQSQVQNTYSEPEEIDQAKIFAMIGFGFSFFSGLVGIILSAMSLNKYKHQKNQDFKAMATAGLILSIIHLGIIVAGAVIGLFFSVILPVLTVLIPSIFAVLFAPMGI